MERRGGAIIKIIFLDIDGVLNTDRQVRINNLKQIDDIDFDKKAMENLKKIIAQTNAKIVIASTWRIHRKENGYLWKELVRNFEAYHINPDLIVDITPVLDMNMKPEIRELEILSWLKANNNVEKFVILDDQWSMGKLNSQFIRCLSFNGITSETAKKSIKILNS